MPAYGSQRAAGEQDAAVVVHDRARRRPAPGSRRRRSRTRRTRRGRRRGSISAPQRGQCRQSSKSPTAGSMCVDADPRARVQPHRPARPSCPGQTLRKLSDRMRRESIAAGAEVVREGDDGDRFYVVLSGMLTVTQEARGRAPHAEAGRLLRRGRAGDGHAADGVDSRADAVGRRELRPRDVRRVRAPAVQRLTARRTPARGAPVEAARGDELDHASACGRGGRGRSRPCRCPCRSAAARLSLSPTRRPVAAPCRRETRARAAPW